MVSRAARHMLGALGSMVTLVVAPGVGFAQPGSARTDEAERIAEEIRTAVETDGPQSATLIGPLSELAVLYEAEGEHALATAALEEARHLVRANYGLHTLDQAPLIQQALENQQALGNLAMVQALEEELFDLATRHPDDLRTVAIHRDIGARRMNLLGRFLGEEYPAEIYGESGVFFFARDDVIARLVAEARLYYANATAVILRNGLYSSAELRDFEMQIVRANDLLRERSRPKMRSISSVRTTSDRTFTSATSGNLQAPEKARASYHLGRESYLRIIAYDERGFGSSAGEAALRSRLEAYLQLADWDLLYSENGVALDQYERVHELLATTDFGEPLIAEIFAPPLPIVLPTFLPNPLQTPVSAHYIDVSFIKASRFRPRVVDGELSRASPVVVRYYLND